MGHVHPKASFRDPFGFRTTARVWVKAKLNREVIAAAFLKSLGVRVKDKANSVGMLYRKYKVRVEASELIVMPCFNDFLGGLPLNRRGRDRYPHAIEYSGPVLRSGSADFDNAETHLLDGSFLGTLKHLRGLG